MFDFPAWYFSLAFPAQIAMAVGSIALAVLSIIFAVYVIKWTILAVVWILKSIAKSIEWGFKKFSEAVKDPCAAPVAQVEKDPFALQTSTLPAPKCVSRPEVKVDENVPRFCAHCGTSLAVNVRNRIASTQSAFCPQCGMHLPDANDHSSASVQA